MKINDHVAARELPSELTGGGRSEPDPSVALVEHDPIQPVRRRRARLASGLAAAAVAAIVAAVAVTAPSDGSSGVASSPSPTSTVLRPITIPTSSWRPGDLQLLALRSGVLGITAQGCPFIGSGDPRSPAEDRTVLIWPAGFTARYAADGKAEILAPNGSVVVHEGDHLAVGGGVLNPSGLPCTVGVRNVFTIMREFTR